MIDIEKGRYWDEGITLVDGCTPCSPGCEHCWSAAMTHRLGDRKRPIVVGKLTNDKGKFTGDIMTHPERLKRFNTRKPKVFSIWNDLFHEAVPPQFVDDVFSSMRFKGASKNTFLVLTKRPQNITPDYFEIMQHSFDNLYLGLTVCNQQEADEKIPIFLQVPGKKFLSIEPMLGAIDLRGLGISCPKSNSDRICADRNNFGCMMGNCKGILSFDAVILGGETGPGARPMNPDWVRSVRDQCAASNTPFFFKSWGAWKGSKDFVGDKSVPGSERIGRLLDGRSHDELPWVKV
jgi:protein gp37